MVSSHEGPVTLEHEEQVQTIYKNKGRELPIVLQMLNSFSISFSGER